MRWSETEDKFRDLAKESLGVPEFSDVECETILQITHYTEQYDEAYDRFILYDHKGIPRYFYSFEQRDAMFLFMKGMALMRIEIMQDGVDLV